MLDMGDEAVRDFWLERHLCSLTTLRPDGTPHVVAVGATLDGEAGLARVISFEGSRKIRNIDAAGPGGMRVAVCQVDGKRWSTIEGLATVKRDQESVTAAENWYAKRYRQPQPNPQRVAVEIVISRILGRV